MNKRDWLLGACCEIPTPRPARESQYATGGVYMGGVRPSQGLHIGFMNHEQLWADGGFINYSASSTFESRFFPTFTPDTPLIVENVETKVYGDPRTGELTETSTNPIDRDQARNDGLASLISALDWSKTYAMDNGVNNHHLCSLDRSLDREVFPCRIGVVSFQRYRWRIPVSHLGSYYKISWDVIRVGGYQDDEVSFVDQNLEWEWTGPGDQNDPDGGSWYSPWFNYTQYMIPPFTDHEYTKWEIANAKLISYTGAQPVIFGDVKRFIG